MVTVPALLVAEFRNVSWFHRLVESRKPNPLIPPTANDEPHTNEIMGIVEVEKGDSLPIGLV